MADGVEWGPGRLWIDVEIGGRRATVYNDRPGHFYGLHPSSGVVRSARSLEELVAQFKSRLRGPA